MKKNSESKPEFLKARGTDQAVPETQRLKVLKTYKAFIDGKFPRTESGRYYTLKNPQSEAVANVCLCSRKDLRDAITAARNAFPKWSKTSAMNRGQILYRMAEMLEGRREQFIDELLIQGIDAKVAEQELGLSIDRLVYYAGWSDKFQQLFSSVNPVASSHFNFSVPEPTGVVGILAPQKSALLGLISVLAPIIVGGNTATVLASSSTPLTAITLAEVLNTSDLPPGVVNILTGTREELVKTFASHMDLNALLYCGEADETTRTVQIQASLNVKRVRIDPTEDWTVEFCQNPYRILEFQEIKTTWHPIGN